MLQHKAILKINYLKHFWELTRMLAYQTYENPNYNIWASSDICWWMTVTDNVIEGTGKDLQIQYNK